jgi:hypothetical protein
LSKLSTCIHTYKVTHFCRNHQLVSAKEETEKTVFENYFVCSYVVISSGLDKQQFRDICSYFSEYFSPSLFGLFLLKVVLFRLFSSRVSLPLLERKIKRERDVGNRVTRLGVLSLIRRLSTLGSFLKNCRNSTKIGATFSTEKVIYYF